MAQTVDARSLAARDRTVADFGEQWTRYTDNLG